MYYMPADRSATFRLAFTSNSLKRHDVNFHVHYKLTRLISIYKHPTKVRLDLWGNVYWINFSRYAIVDQFDVMRALEYRQARVTRIFNSRRRINTRRLNAVYLDPHRRFAFTPQNIARIRRVGNKVSCKLRIRFETRRRRRGAGRTRRSRQRRLASQDKSTNKRQTVSKPHKLKKVTKSTSRRRRSSQQKAISELRQEIRDGKEEMNRLYRRRRVADSYIMCSIK